MDKSSVIALVSVIGAGAVYFIMRNNDDTPVGLNVDAAPIATTGLQFEKDGEDELSTYRVATYKGTYRESEDSIPLYSTDDTSLMVVYGDDGEIVDVITIDDDDAFIQGGGDYNPNADDNSIDKLIAYFERAKHFSSKYGTTKFLDAQIESLKEARDNPPATDNAQTQNAEMQMFGHINLNALQSNHAW